MFVNAINIEKSPDHRKKEENAKRQYKIHSCVIHDFQLFLFIFKRCSILCLVCRYSLKSHTKFGLMAFLSALVSNNNNNKHTFKAMFVTFMVQEDRNKAKKTHACISLLNMSSGALKSL